LSSGKCRGFVGVRQKGMEIDVTTNTVEGMFGIFKRGMVGIYQHCGEQHLQRYLDEFTARWNNRSKLGVEDQERARIAAYGMNEKRLTYRWTEAG
jgi:hypothetical protein